MRRNLTYAAVLLGLLAGVMALAGQASVAGGLLLAASACCALALQSAAGTRTYAFSAWVMTFVIAALLYPARFQTWGEFELKLLIVPLIQVIMFGMGTTLGVSDFLRTFAMPRAVLLGIFLQFTIMPLVGYGLATGLGFEPEIAAGVILVGCCPGGVASNLMAFLAKGDVALSVTMTAMSTLVSPVMTPLMMKTLAGQLLEIDAMAMMWSILNMILLPIAAGLIANAILKALKLRGPWVDRALSLLAMAAICFIIAIITSLSREELLSVGPALMLVVVAHNGLGYVLGYGGARLLRLDESSCRTVAIEVGLQNGGMASGLAIRVLQSPAAALAPALFGPWMNISGSVLASWWRARPVKTGQIAPSDSHLEDPVE